MLTKDEMPTVLLRPSHESLNTEMVDNHFATQVNEKVDLEKDGVKFNLSYRMIWKPFN